MSFAMDVVKEVAARVAGKGSGSETNKAYDRVFGSSGVQNGIVNAPSRTADVSSAATAVSPTSNVLISEDTKSKILDATNPSVLKNTLG